MIYHNARMGEFLGLTERGQYTEEDYNPPHPQQIFVHPDAEDFPDASFWQKEIDWDKMMSQTRAVVLRIGQATWQDTQFERNYTEGRSRGAILGGYVFYDDRYSPQQHFEMIAKAMNGKYFDKEIVVDWERLYGGFHGDLSDVVALMELIEAAGIKCHAVGMYTGYYFFIEHTDPIRHASQFAYLKVRPLHIAWYASADLVRIPRPWTEYTDWQYGTPPEGYAHGCWTIEIDKNKSKYTNAEFPLVYAGGEIPEPPTEPPPGEAMYLGTTLVRLNLRDAPSGNWLLTMSTNSKLDADRIENGWWHVLKINGVAVAQESWAFEGDTNGYIRLDEVVEPPTTPPNELPAYFIGYNNSDEALARYNIE